MKTNNTNTNTNAMINTIVSNFANAMKNAISNKEGEIAKAIFANLKEYKSKNDTKTAFEVQKLFNSYFTKLELAQAKQLAKVDANKVTGTSETAKENCNILFLSIEEQRQKIRGLVNSMYKKGVFELHYTKQQYLNEFDKLTEGEFTNLYCGNVVKKDTIIRVLTNRLNKAEKEYKKNH